MLQVGSMGWSLYDWPALVALAFLFLGLFLFMFSRFSFGLKLSAGGTCLIMALLLLGYMAMNEGDKLNSVHAKTGNNAIDYLQTTICVDSNADEESLTLIWSPSRPLPTSVAQMPLDRVVVLMRREAQYCGRIGPFETNTVATVTVKHTSRDVWLIREFYFQYPDEGDTNTFVAGKPIRVYPSPEDGYYRFRIIGADLSQDIPTASIPH